MKLGQTVLMRKPDNEPTGGQNKTRYMNMGYQKELSVECINTIYWLILEHGKATIGYLI
jgi:hypothetical protein